VPFFPLGGFTPLQSSTLSDVAEPARGHADAGRAGLAAAPLAQHPADPRHLVGRPPAREPGATARALLLAMSWFQHPAHAAEWAAPGIDASYNQVWQLLMNGLCIAESPG
jgi:hypothetical protein